MTFIYERGWRPLYSRLHAVLGTAWVARPAGKPPRPRLCPTSLSLLANLGACDRRVTRWGGGALGPSFAGTEIPSSAPTREETRTPSSLEGGVTGFRPGECWMRVGHGYLCRGSIPLCRAGTGGLLFFSEKKGPPPCATSSFCRLCTCLAGPSGKVGSCGIGDAGDYGGWQCRSSFRSAPSTLSHHKKLLSTVGRTG